MKKCYSEKISKYKHDAKKTWRTMKELVGKTKLKSSNLARKIIFNEVDIFDELKIAIEFNPFFTNIGSKLASKIPNASTTLESYMIYSFICTLFIVDNRFVFSKKD